jgi:hypothetical protein
MSVPFGSNILTFSAVAKQLRMTFETFTDRRRGKNTRYTLVDAALSAFSSNSRLPVNNLIIQVVVI